MSRCGDIHSVILQAPEIKFNATLDDAPFSLHMILAASPDAVGDDKIRLQTSRTATCGTCDERNDVSGPRSGAPENGTAVNNPLSEEKTADSLQIRDS
jgi:hypothetical protein